MEQQKSRRNCAIMLLVSILLRCCMFLGLDQKAFRWLADPARTLELARWAIYLETGQVVSTEVPEVKPTLYVLRKLPPEPSQPKTAEGETVAKPAAELHWVGADSISMAGGCTYPVDKAALLSRPSTLDFSGDGPKILIVHTHTTEGYTPEPGWEYEATSPYRTLDLEHSVVAVGNMLAETLEKNGISVLHDTSVNDYPSYNSSYYTALQKIEDWKARYPDLQMVIDVHRDAVEDGVGHAVALSAVQGTEEYAKLMLVVGTDQGGLPHPNWQENLANALKLQSALEGSYPGLCRSLDLRTERFNQHATPGSLIVEVGSNGNTLRQALRSAQALGETLAAMITAQKAGNGGMPG